MNANNILFIGIGQAGGNLCEQVCKTNRRITSVVFNTSMTDMENLNHVKTIAFPDVDGAGRNREQAKKYLKDEAALIVDTINSYKMKDTVFIAFAMGGGTGSGMSTVLLNLLYSLDKDKVYHIIPILPFEKETKGMQENAIQCWKELSTLFDKNIGAIYLIDNNKRKTKQAINREFADLFNLYLDCTNHHVDGVLDGRELEILGTSKGLTAIIDIKRHLDEPKEIIDNVIKDSIFVSNTDIIENIGISAPSEFNREYLEDKLKPFGESFEGYSEKNSILILSGMKATNKAIEKTYDIYTYKKLQLEENRKLAEQKLAEEDLELSLEITKKPITKKCSTIADEVKIDDVLDNSDDFWDKIMNM